MWTAVSLVGGAVFGPAGFYWRRGAFFPRVAAVSLLGGVFVAEGAYLTLILPDKLIGAGFAVAGLIVPIIVGRSWHERLYGWLGRIPVLVLGAFGYLAFLALANLSA